MNKLNIKNSNHKWYRYNNNILYTVLFVVIPGCIMYTYVDYKMYGLSRYVIIDLTNLVTILLAYVTYKFSLIHKVSMMVIAVYSLVIALGVSLIASISDPYFNFESFFITAEMLLVLLVFAIGLFVHLQSIFAILIFNTLFIVLSIFTSGKNYPLEKFIFYGVVVIGAGIMAYLGQKAVVKLYKKIKAANILVNVQNEELKAINNSKDELFKIIGHDLMTPFYQLTNLINLLDDAKDEKEKQQIKESIQEASEKGAQLLDDLLHWGENTKEHSNIILKNQNANSILTNVLNFSKTNAEIKQITITNTLEENFKIKANNLMLETVLRNVIANAIKFSHRNSTIIIKSSFKNGIKSIVIEDKGIGIKTKHLESLFNNSKIKTKRGTENEKGNGFGLNISKKLMEKQKGTLSVESEFGMGTSVFLNFSVS